MRSIFLQISGLLLLSLMILVPTDIFRMGMEHLFELDEGVYLLMESELDAEEEKEGKEKKTQEKEKNKLINSIFGFLSASQCDRMYTNASFTHRDSHLAHYLDVWTPPPELG